MVYARTSEIDLCLVRDLEKRKHRTDITPNLDVQFMADALTKKVRGYKTAPKDRRFHMGLQTTRYLRYGLDNIRRRV